MHAGCIKNMAAMIGIHPNILVSEHEQEMLDSTLQLALLLHST
jgi:hypothetical protein